MNNILSPIQSIIKCLMLLMVVLLQCSCQLQATKDHAPSYKLNPNTIHDAVPREDPITRAGNKNPYTVLGKTYHLLASSAGYKEQGIASWYGKKFQGRPTANGEPYNLYGMTAAHKTLPIPAYVKVTNLDNNRTAIVRVNDRGPFHHQRIIDLSYAAAVKLGYADQGTARVLVETINPNQKSQPRSVARPITRPIPSKAPPLDVLVPDDDEHYLLQVGAFKDYRSANSLRDELQLKTGQPVQVSASEPKGYYRVQVGPMAKMEVVLLVTNRLRELNIHQPRLITEKAP